MSQNANYWLTVGTVQLLFVFERVLVLEANATTATISPNGYITSLDPESSTTFQCHITGADSIYWVVDGAVADVEKVRRRGIKTSDLVTLDQSERRFTSNITIPRSTVNRNTTLLCVANAISSPDALSEPVYFKVQGLLDFPPNLTLATTNDAELEGRAFLRRLTWDEPLTLDVTDVDPDISHYRVCYNIGEDGVKCETTTEREFTFVDVRVNILFLVTAVNVVGEGNTSSILHRACVEETDSMNSSVSKKEVTCIPALLHGRAETESGEVSVNFTVMQNITASENQNCFDVYEVWTSMVGSDSAVTKHGRQIPQVSIDSNGSTRRITLSLYVDSSSGLRLNEVYNATIMSASNDGNLTNVANVLFSTYDMQSVSIKSSPNSDRLELSCSFITGSSAQSCILTVCEQQNDVIINHSSCVNVTIVREPDRQMSSLVVSHEFGASLLRITAVAEVERDGRVTAVRLRPSMEHDREKELPVAISSTHATTTHSSTISQDGMKSEDKHYSPIIMISAGAGLGLLTVICVLLAVILVATWYRHHSKMKTAVEPVYDEPYSLTSRSPIYDEPHPQPTKSKREMHMEDCPAYGIVSNRRAF